MSMKGNVTMTAKEFQEMRIANTLAEEVIANSAVNIAIAKKNEKAVKTGNIGLSDTTRIISQYVRETRDNTYNRAQKHDKPNEDEEEKLKDSSKAPALSGIPLIIRNNTNRKVKIISPSFLRGITLSAKGETNPITIPVGPISFRYKIHQGGNRWKIEQGKLNITPSRVRAIEFN